MREQAPRGVYNVAGAYFGKIAQAFRPRGDTKKTPIYAHTSIPGTGYPVSRTRSVTGCERLRWCERLRSCLKVERRKSVLLIYLRLILSDLLLRNTCAYIPLCEHSCVEHLLACFENSSIPVTQISCQLHPMAFIPII